ncbi:hypothetical protein [Micropruina sp.]|uniref:LppU/SCO3897 family protein n=1 Tax=Micropruina sp. TaxID=2737536 RepID=UPI0039E54CD9
MSANQPPEDTDPQNLNAQPAQPAPAAPDGAAPQDGQVPQYAANSGYSASPQQGAPAAAQFGPDGQPLPPGAYPPAGSFQPPVAEPAKQGGKLKRILTSVGIALVAVVVGIVWRSGVFDSPSMKVGDCVQQTGSDSVKVVDCGSADAQFKILGIQEKVSQASARMGACADWADTTSVYWQGRNSSSGIAYCLQKLG